LGRAFGTRTVGELISKRPANPNVYLHDLSVIV
jgi:hypothetical protein